MDILSVFQQKLKPVDQSLETLEESWDQRAETFYTNQVKGSTYYNDAVPRLLEQKNILNPSVSVLDIGAGSGRYAIPIAKRSQSVHALDLSSEMLQFLEREIKENSLDNIHTIKSAWPTTENIGEFDVAFAAMCPATRSVEALEAMSHVAKKHGVICQFTESTDSVIETLKKHQLIDGDERNPHNDRDLLQSYFNILWELGYQPEISYLNDTFEVDLSYDEALETYKKRYEDIEVEGLKSILSTIQNGADRIKVIKRTTLAVISWETQEKEF